MNQDSYVEIDSTVVRDLCEKTIERVAKFKEAKIQTIILDQFSKRTHSWFRKKLSYEEVEAQVRAEVASRSIYSPYFNFQLIGWNELDVAKRLLKACTMGSTILVATRDLDELI